MMRPMGARVLVKRLPEPKTSSSLLVIPETAEDAAPSKFGLVLAVGKLVNGGFSVGDIVILSNYAGAPCVVELDSEQIEASVVNEDDVLAVVEGM